MIAKLTDPWFEAHFITGCEDDGSFHMHHPDGSPITFAEAQGIAMWCPCGYGKPEFPLDGPRPHLIEIPFANPPSGVSVPPNFGPLNREKTAHPRWIVTGTGLADLTLAPSVDVGTVSCWHGFIQQGDVK